MIAQGETDKAIVMDPAQVGTDALKAVEQALAGQAGA